MADHRVVSFTRLPSRAPALLSIVWWLLLDRLQAPGWVWGATGLMIFILWLVFIVSSFNEVGTDPFEKERE